MWQPRDRSTLALSQQAPTPFGPVSARWARLTLPPLTLSGRIDPPSPPTGPSLATSVYETHLGLVALSWSRTSLGLSLRAVLRLSPPPHSAPGSSSSASGAGYLDDDADEEEATLAFRARPWLLWRRRGTRRFRAGDRLVDLAWDLSRARLDRKSVV